MTARLGYVSALDGIRGIAILAVIGQHFFSLPGGYFGVDLFFVLSGFLITTLLLEEHARTGRISLRRFYKRRVRRLAPGLGAVLFLSLVLAALFAEYGRADLALARLKAVAACALYVGNLVRISGPRFPLELSQMWSLAQEEQFYIVWPVTLLLLLRLGVTGRRLAGFLAVVAVSLMIWRGVLAWGNGPTARVYFGPDTRADGLLLGAVFAVLRHAGIARTTLGLARMATPALLGFAVLVFITRPSGLTYSLGFPAVEVIALLLIVNGLSGRARLLSWPPLVWLGSISYGVYLWQGGALLVVGNRAVAGLVSVCLGYASTRWIEAPFRARPGEARSRSVRTSAEPVDST